MTKTHTLIALCILLSLAGCGGNSMSSRQIVDADGGYRGLTGGSSAGRAHASALPVDGTAEAGEAWMAEADDAGGGTP
jgi:hypothetical protein